MTTTTKSQTLWLNAKSLLKDNRPHAARDVVQSICESSPSDLTAWMVLGQIEGQIGDFASAGNSFTKAISLAPAHAEAHYGLGCTFVAQQKYSDAIASFNLAISLRPTFVDALNDLGYALQISGRLDQAVEVYSRSLRINSQQFSTLYNLGLIRKDQKAFKDAENHFRSALILNPGSSEAHNSLGFVLKEMGHLQDAEHCLQRALEIDPNNADAQFNMGSTLSSMLRFFDAESYFRTALRIRPGFPDALNCLGGVLLGKGDIAGAEDCYRQALLGKPVNTAAYSNLLMSLHYREDISPHDLFDEHVKWGRQFRLSGDKRYSFQNSPDPLRRLRVGYVSADFCIHSVANFLLPLFINHNAAQVELVCYSNTDRQDEITQRFRELTSLWRDIRGFSDDEFIRQIREDCIDILVDVSGHTARNRLRAFSDRCAPIQLTYLGYPDTTGLQTMDYRLTDCWADPPGHEAFNTEKLLYLPGGFLCYAPIFDSLASTQTPLHARGYVTFGSFNNLSKVNKSVLHCWAAILRAVPDSRLLLKTKSFWDSAVIEHFRSHMTDCGIAPESVELRPWSVHPKDHISNYQEVDIALDTFPYNGTTTTCEAMWMGVPVITLAGNIHAGRVGVSLLTSIGLEELIAVSQNDYIAIASSLAKDSVRLTKLHESLRLRMRQSRLCDGKTSAQEIEHAFRAIWQKWCADTHDVSLR